MEVRIEYAVLGFTKEKGWEDFRPFGWNLTTLEQAITTLEKWKELKANEPFPGAYRDFEELKISKRTITYSEWEDA